MNLVLMMEQARYRHLRCTETLKLHGGPFVPVIYKWTIFFQPWQCFTHFLGGLIKPKTIKLHFLRLILWLDPSKYVCVCMWTELGLLLLNEIKTRKRVKKSSPFFGEDGQEHIKIDIVQRSAWEPQVYFKLIRGGVILPNQRGKDQPMVYTI